MNEWNDLFFLNEADDEEEKKKSEDKKKDDDDKEEKKSKKKDDDEKDEDSDDEYNDLMDDDTDNSSDTDDDSSDTDDNEYNDLMSDDGLEPDLDDDDSDNSSDDDSSSEYNTLVVVKGGDDGDSSEDSNMYECAAKVAYACIVVSNNLKHIHLNACGEKFQEIHNLCDEYNHHCSYSADFYYELAAESPFVTIDNPTRAKEHCEDISVEMDKDYNFRKALEVVSSNFSSLINYLTKLREASSSRPDIQSTVDNDISYLNKQTKYFIRKKLCGEDTSLVGESYNYNDLL